MLVCKVTLKHE
uniref:Uncharacterized protein n=1 Tax=Anguilla anguilla TaxID=7936 RepID=A0A0E9U6B5_ANGAN